MSIWQDKALGQVLAQLQPALKLDPVLARMRVVYGSTGAALDAEPTSLAQFTDIHPDTAQTITMLPMLARYVQAERSRAMGKLNTFALAGRYLCGLYLGYRDERSYLLCLDDAGRLLMAQPLQQGTVDETPFYPRHILSTALKCNAHAIILSHNHPSGICSFSKGDVSCTVKLLKLLIPLEIQLLDHILIADGKAYSMHGVSALSQMLSNLQRSTDPLLAGWLRGQEDDS